MGMQAGNTSAGKTTTPPQPDYGQTKPLQMGDVGTMKPQPMGDVGTMKPMAMDTPVQVNTKPLNLGPVGGDIGTMKPAAYNGDSGGGAGGAAPTILYSKNGVTLDSSGLRTYADGSTERVDPEVARVQSSQGVIDWASRLTGNGGPPTTGGGAAGGQGGGGGGGGGGGPGGGPTWGGGGGGASWGGGGFGVNGVPAPVDDASRKRVEAAILSRLEPQFREDESKMRNQLLSSGLEVGSPAYASELDRLSRAQNDARMQAVLAGGTEESRQVGLNAGLQGQAFGQGLQGAQFDNATRQQMLSELLLQRNTPLNELNALRTGSQVAMPNFSGYYTNNAAAAPVFDAAQAQGNYNMAAAQQEQSGFNALLGGLGSLGAAGITKFSDIRLKTDVKKLGRTSGGHNLYSWKWRDGSGHSTGVIAQEVQKVLPSAVVEDASGFLMVDYSQIH